MASGDEHRGGRRPPSVPLMSETAAFAFYGTLRRGGGALGRLGLGDLVRYVGPCTIPGRLHLIAWYPGLVPGDGAVVGDLFEVDAAAVPTIDRFEGHVPDDPARSLYDRLLVPLVVPPEVAAWTYVWRGEVPPGSHIPGGDWLAHRRT